MNNTERSIIYMIIHDIPISRGTIDVYLKYLEKVTRSDSPSFDNHCKLINNLTDTDFNKYMSFLSINSKE